MRVDVEWRLPVGQYAVSSYGLGNFQQVLKGEALETTLFVEGPLQSLPSRPPAQGFSMYSLGLPQNALALAFHWTQQAYGVERNAFHGSPSAPFRFMIRSYDGGPIMSGRADYRSFLLYLPAGKDPGSPDLHALVAHEMVHALIEGLDAEPGDDGDWYTEGTADYFRITLPYSAGLYTPQEYLSQINEEAAEYYTNALAQVPNRDISKAMWSGRNAWMVPYARGALYFADLEAKLRDHGSQWRVPDLVNETSRRIRKGQPAMAETWVAVLNQYVGPWALSDWQKMMSGQLLMPDSKAFGSCLSGERIEVGTFDLGFKTPVRLRTGLVINGVIAGSPAARAGLRNGDVIQADIDINPLASSFHRLISIPVFRHGSRFTVIYDPHVRSKQGMHWVARSGDPYHPCLSKH